MKDDFARQTASNAHITSRHLGRRQDELERTVRALTKRVPPRPHFAGRCSLCGEPARGRYCHEHDWAEG